MADSLEERGMVPKKSFHTLFRPLEFNPSMKSKERPKSDPYADAWAAAYGYLYNAKIKPMTEAYRQVGSGYELANEKAKDGYTALFIPLPVPTDSGLQAKKKHGAKLLFVRVDCPNGQVVETMKAKHDAYFTKCVGLGKPVEGVKWVWISRCIAPGQHVLFPLSPGASSQWANELPDADSGSYAAQAKVEMDGKYVVPDETHTYQENQDFWAMVFGGSREPDPVEIVVGEAPTPRMDLVPPSIRDQAVVAFAKGMDKVMGGYSNESRDAPARDTPSVVAEFATAVAVAATVAVVSGAVAAIV